MSLLLQLYISQSHYKDNLYHEMDVKRHLACSCVVLSLVAQELLTLPEHLSSPLVFSGVRVTRSLVLYVLSCRSLFVLLYFFFWSLCCLFFFDIRILITLLVSSTSSYFCRWTLHLGMLVYLMLFDVYNCMFACGYGYTTLHSFNIISDCST